MKIPRYFAIVMLLFSFAGISGKASAQTNIFAASGTQISFADLNSGKVIGKLGHPLGSRLTISGIGSKEFMGSQNPLNVSKVNNQILGQPPAIEIRGFLNYPVREGEKYDFEGYETGGFVGNPAWLTPPGAARQNPSFYFHTYFMVTKVIAQATGQAAEGTEQP